MHGPIHGPAPHDTHRSAPHRDPAHLFDVLREVPLPDGISLEWLLDRIETDRRVRP